VASNPSGRDWRAPEGADRPAGGRARDAGADGRDFLDRLASRAGRTPASITGMTDSGTVFARHAVAISTVREFAQRSGAHRVVLLLDGGEGSATMFELAHGAPLELTEHGVTYAVDPAAADVAPLPLPELRPAPATALAVDPVAGEVAAPLGVLANLGEGLLGLAAAFGGLSVATADFPTRNPEHTLTIAARPGEPLVLAVGDQQFALPEGWPSRSG
jgi:hypothetical protein